MLGKGGGKGGEGRVRGMILGELGGGVGGGGGWWWIVWCFYHVTQSILSYY